MNDFRRIVFLGDSITQAGDYVTDVGCWLVGQGFAGDVINVGLSSESATDLTPSENARHLKAHGFGHPLLSHRLGRVLAETRPDLLFACYGMNDSDGLPAGDEGVQRFAVAMTCLRTSALAAGVKRVVLCTPPVHDVSSQSHGPSAQDEKLAGYRDWLISMRADGWDVVDIHGPMSRELEVIRQADPSFRFAPDGVHPGREGHWFLARQILNQYFSADIHTLERVEQSFPANGKEIRELVQKRIRILWSATMSVIGHDRPGVTGYPDMPPGPSIKHAEAEAALIDAGLEALKR
jgi:lysophospholipase L1-like esterase